MRQNETAETPPTNSEKPSDIESALILALASIQAISRPFKDDMLFGKVFEIAADALDKADEILAVRAMKGAL